MKVYSKNMKRIAFLFMFFSMFVISITAPIAAKPKGTVRYYHGANASKCSTFGSIESTAVENNMSVNGKVRFDTGFYQGRTLPYINRAEYNVKTSLNEILVDHVKGASFFDYYVDGIKEHSSTAWWNFDFR